METILEPRAPNLAAGQVGMHSKSAASWSAIIAGAFAAAAVSLVLFALGSGLGFASVSPWQNRGVSMTTFAVATAIWFIVMQWLSSAAGGYLAGRLRTRWIGTNPHEVFFRDTAHGFVTWAVATVLVATLLASSLSSALSGGVHAVTGVAAGAAQGIAAAASPSDVYGVDRLFRSADPSAASAQSGSDARLEAGHIIMEAVVSGREVSEADRTYLASLVAARTGASPADAQKRVEDFITSAKDAEAKVKAAADAARTAAADASIYTALAMVIGAFIASLSAALGGRLRDEHP